MHNYSKIDQPHFLSFIFAPHRCEPTPPPPCATDVEIEVEQDVTIGCRFYINSPESPNILYFHGNGEITADYDDIGPLYNHAGLNLLVADYRGYGWSSGSPSVASMLSDGEIIFREAKNWLKRNEYTGAFFLMGRSLGSVPAIELATNHEDDIKGLILESAIADTIPILKTLGLNIDPKDFTEEDGFRNLQKIESVKTPTFIFHGARDSLIPADQAEKIQSHSGARTKEFMIIPGAEHNTMILTGGKLYFLTIKQFIDKLTGATNWRKRRKVTNKYSGELP